jgi:hypothetical protein
VRERRQRVALRVLHGIFFYFVCGRVAYVSSSSTLRSVCASACSKLGTKLAVN